MNYIIYMYDVYNTYLRNYVYNMIKEYIYAKYNHNKYNKYTYKGHTMTTLIQCCSYCCFLMSQEERESSHFYLNVQTKSSVSIGF